MENGFWKHAGMSKVDWPHAPPHRLSQGGVTMVTAGTYLKAPLFEPGPKLRMLHEAILKIPDRHGWALEAWAVFPNHYHFMARPRSGSGPLRSLIRELHSRTARALNQADGVRGRKVWHNYWDTEITLETSYYARLHYVHTNAVHHGLVAVANQYPFASAHWFERVSDGAFVKTVYGFKTDRLNVNDDF